MRTKFAAIAFALLGIAACRENVTMESDKIGVGKPIEQTKTQLEQHDDDFIQTRSSFEKSTQERLDRLDTRIDQLESRTDAAGHGAAIQLRHMRDKIADRSAEVGRQTEVGWDRFEAEMSRSVDELEHDVDRLLGY